MERCSTERNACENRVQAARSAMNEIDLILLVMIEFRVNCIRQKNILMKSIVRMRRQKRVWIRISNSHIQILNLDLIDLE